MIHCKQCFPDFPYMTPLHYLTSMISKISNIHSMVYICYKYHFTQSYALTHTCCKFQTHFLDASFESFQYMWSHQAKPPCVKVCNLYGALHILCRLHTFTLNYVHPSSAAPHMDLSRAWSLKSTISFGIICQYNKK